MTTYLLHDDSIRSRELRHEIGEAIGDPVTFVEHEGRRIAVCSPFEVEILSRREDVIDDCFYLAFNAHHEAIEFTLPAAEYAQSWTVVIDTAEMDEVEPTEVKPGDRVTVGARAMVVLSAAQ